MNKNKTMKLVLLFLSLAGIGYAACQYCKSDSSDGTTSNCSSACVKHTYVPAYEHCENTQDTLRCVVGDAYNCWVIINVGTCVNGLCQNIRTFDRTDTYNHCNSDDGCMGG
jgi:hypothetical protein